MSFYQYGKSQVSPGLTVYDKHIIFPNVLRTYPYVLMATAMPPCENAWEIDKVWALIGGEN